MKAMDQSLKRIDAALQQLFPSWSANERVNVKRLTEAYHQYKMEYVRHFSFTPDKEILSKFIFCGFYMIFFSARACPIGSSVYLL